MMLRPPPGGGKVGRHRHCERSEAIFDRAPRIATARRQASLAMTGPDNEKGSEMAEYVKVGKLGDFPAGAIRPVSLGGEPVAVANVLGRLYCFSNYCTHVGLELSSGDRSESSLTH